MDEKKYLSINEFTKIVKENLESSYPIIYLRGEISNFRPSSTGHWYFYLKDQYASIKAIIFKNSQNSILSILKSFNINSLSDGQDVLVEGKISLYERNGEYSIIINKLIPVGIGELSIKFEMLKEKLQKEGLFDQSIKKPLPKYPSHIGIVTSPTAAALKDILNVLKRRFASIKITVFPTSVQGENAKYEIEKAINFTNYNYINNTKYKVDVLIISRGGGSIEDLWPFNEEIVAYSIYNSSVPIITGIGHEIDYTIADFCADLRAPTPSAAAEIVVKNTDDLINSISAFNLRLTASFSNLIDKYKLRLDPCNSQRLNLLFEKKYYTNLQDFSYIVEKMQNNFKDYYNNLNKNFIFLVKRLDNVNPLKILSKGYSIVLDNENNVVKSYSQIKKDDNLSVILSKGEISVKVKEIFNKSDKISQ
jgi:exodeoxyribonuclease VII large subunit